MHSSAFEYLKPTDAQIERMGQLRLASKLYCETLEQLLPEGSDKTYIIRKFRELAMWNNVAITRLPDGTPRV